MARKSHFLLLRSMHILQYCIVQGKLTYSDTMKYALCIPAVCASMAVGFLMGRMLSVEPTSIYVQQDRRKLIPTIRIDGIRNSQLHGAIVGDARFVLGDTILISSGAFTIDASSLLTNTVDIIVPDGMHFVASSRGKKYYPVFSAAANRIVPRNRIYFPTAAAAERAGYKQ